MLRPPTVESNASKTVSWNVNASRIWSGMTLRTIGPQGQERELTPRKQKKKNGPMKRQRVSQVLVLIPGLPKHGEQFLAPNPKLSNEHDMQITSSMFASVQLLPGRVWATAGLSRKQQERGTKCPPRIQSDSTLLSL